MFFLSIVLQRTFYFCTRKTFFWFLLLLFYGANRRWNVMRVTQLFFHVDLVWFIASLSVFFSQLDPTSIVFASTFFWWTIKSNVLFIKRERKKSIIVMESIKRSIEKQKVRTKWHQKRLVADAIANELKYWLLIGFFGIFSTSALDRMVKAKKLRC